jgi:tetratricopeptide (TPR) repeat protein
VDDDTRLGRARELYERAVFGGDRAALGAADAVLDAVEADLALARGRVVHARFLEARSDDPRERELFARAATLYRGLGDSRGEGEALLWMGLYEQVVRGDHEAALPSLRRAHELATAAGDDLTRSYVVRHLGFADLAAGDLAAARARLEESVALRRALDFPAGVAAGLVALAHLAREEGRDADAAPLLDEAEAIARACGAAGVLAWVAEARA